MTPARPELAVILPVYNEEEIIAKVMDDWAQELERLQINFEIHAYNDGSKDNTLKILKENAEKNKRIVVHHKSNTGHGPTILLGYQENSDVKWMFQADSDDEISSQFFEEFWLRRKGFDFLLGRRVGREGPLSRRFVSFAARMLVRIFYGQGVHDVNCPYRLMKSDVFKSSLSQMEINTFAPNVIISGVACKNKCRILEIPVSYSKRTTGEVSIQRWKLLKAVLKGLWQTILFRFRI
jgi:glycosyltransferase involved in cell wall biosynthesis